MRFIFLVFLFAACSTQHDKVTGTPPDFNTAQSLGTEYGRVSMTGVSVFLWPTMPPGPQAAAVYAQVAADAAASDDLELKEKNDQKSLNDLNSSGFDYSPCFTNFEAACSSNPPVGSSCDDVQLNSDVVQTWVYKSVDQVPTDDLKKLYVACRDFTDKKTSLESEIATIAKKDTELTRRILFSIDPEYEKTGVETNYKTVLATNSDNTASTSFTINPDESVVISLLGFNDPDTFQSNVSGMSTYKDSKNDQFKIYGVSYSHENRSLVFKVPEVIGGQLTGGVYSFTLERNNFGGNPRFSGDIIFTKNSSSKNGSAKFDGFFCDDHNPCTRDLSVAPPTPLPTPTPIPSPAPSPTVAAPVTTPTPVPSPTVTPVATPVPDPAATPSPSPIPLPKD